ncbi:hypothetical protein VFPBJ_01127 [Purpureocillium lilacinum]|uniref:Uncharacterized protein n=1 Tax=Purpureocillium lilacinum TaxID=33203 RepID=A0A179HAB2_PURLI|nr:hypothetical protein VFPBJ_01127 [Purpureocillium lilacinum]
MLCNSNRQSWRDSTFDCIVQPLGLWTLTPKTPRQAWAQTGLGLRKAFVAADPVTSTTRAAKRHAAYLDL